MDGHNIVKAMLYFVLSYIDQQNFIGRPINDRSQVVYQTLLEKQKPELCQRPKTKN